MGGCGARCASPRMAVLRVPGCGRVLQHSWCGAALDGHSAGASEVSVRPGCSRPLHLLPYFLADPVSTPTSSGCCSSAASGALSLCPRPFAGAAVHSTPLATTGQTRFRVGERGSSGVQRGGGPCLTERAVWLPGLATSWGCGPETTRSGRGWVAAVPWRAARHRHNDGLPSQG